MRKFFYSFLLFAFANLIVLDLYSFECLPKNQIWIAPEFYHVHRTREGGTYQNGFLYGGRAAYERIAGRCFYLGLEGYIATGSIHGKGGNDQKLRSTLTDSSVEGRVGYTFQLNYCYEFLFTPYLGYGYFWETNKFHRPKDLQVHFYNRFSYVPLGFLFNVNICPTWAIGLNFKARVLVDGKIKTKHDPEFQNSNLQYEHKVQ